MLPCLLWDLGAGFLVACNSCICIASASVCLDTLYHAISHLPHSVWNAISAIVSSEVVEPHCLSWLWLLCFFALPIVVSGLVSLLSRGSCRSLPVPSCPPANQSFFHRMVLFAFVLTGLTCCSSCILAMRARALASWLLQGLLAGLCEFLICVLWGMSPMHLAIVLAALGHVASCLYARLCASRVAPQSAGSSLQVVLLQGASSTEESSKCDAAPLSSVEPTCVSPGLRAAKARPKKRPRRRFMLRMAGLACARHFGFSDSGSPRHSGEAVP